MSRGIGNQDLGPVENILSWMNSDWEPHPHHEADSPFFSLAIAPRHNMKKEVEAHK